MLADCDDRHGGSVCTRLSIQARATRMDDITARNSFLGKGGYHCQLGSVTRILGLGWKYVAAGEDVFLRRT